LNIVLPTCHFSKRHISAHLGYQYWN